MALTLDLNSVQGEMWISDRRIFVTVDRSRAVSAEDPAAAFLLVGEGGSLPMSEAIQYGLVGGFATKQEPKAEPETESTVNPTEESAAKPKRKSAK